MRSVVGGIRNRVSTTWLVPRPRDPGIRQSVDIVANDTRGKAGVADGTVYKERRSARINGRGSRPKRSKDDYLAVGKAGLNCLVDAEASAAQGTLMDELVISELSLMPPAKRGEVAFS